MWLLKMYSLTVKPSFVPQVSRSYSSSSLSVSYCSTRSCSSLSFPIRTKYRGTKRLALRIHAYDSSKDDASNASGDSKPPNGTLVSLPPSLV